MKCHSGPSLQEALDPTSEGSVFVAAAAENAAGLEACNKPKTGQARVERVAQV